MDIQQRIEQFRNMANADPTNDMAHFSLGINLLQANEPEEAIPSLLEAIQLNPGLSKAYQLVGDAFRKTGETQKAIDYLTRGYEVAVHRGDVMPKQAIAKMLEELQAPIPDVKPTETPAVSNGTFICQSTGKPGNKLEKPPFKGKLGERIFETISKETWQLWINQGTKVINELRLDLSREDHQNIYDENMIEFLNLQEWAADNL